MRLQDNQHSVRVFDIFRSALPVLQRIAFVANIFDIRVDGHELLKEFRCPSAHGTSDIGMWHSVSLTYGCIAVISNSGIVCFQTNLLGETPEDITDTARVWIFFCSHMQYLLDYFLSQSPTAICLLMSPFSWGANITTIKQIFLERLPKTSQIRCGSGFFLFQYAVFIGMLFVAIINGDLPPDVTIQLERQDHYRESVCGEVLLGGSSALERLRNWALKLPSEGKKGKN